MPQWDSQTFSFRSFNAVEVALELHRVALEGAVPTLEINIPEGASGPVPVFKRLTLTAFDELEDHPPERWSELVVTMQASSDTEGELYLQATCDDTRLEVVESANGGSPTTLRLETGSLRRSVLVRALLVHDAGLVVGESPPVEIVVDRPALQVGGGLRVEWNEERFKDRPGAISLVDTYGSDPVIYLNSRIDSFYALMNSHKRGISGALRRLLLTQIEVDTWLALGAYIRRLTIEAEIDLEVDGDDTVSETLNERCLAILERLRGLTGREDLVSVLQLIDNPDERENIRSLIASKVKEQPSQLLARLLKEIGQRQ